ncbi:MAG TPA: shikimate kinase [Gemmatimonadales bacterium]|nr:shikimate kinase [Gemmatimonadales bacterium]
MKRHVLLVGLPGVGKSTVGQLVAEGLEAPLLDIDSILVRQMGMPVAQMFGMLGEARFRSMERDAVQTAQAREPAVIVPGAGWAAQPGQLDEASRVCLIIYMKCAAKTAARRSQGSEVRPLLEGADPVERTRALLQAREPFYKLAHYEVSADTKTPAAIAEEVVGLARAHGGW